MKEEWKKTNINAFYSVSNLGRVRHDTNGLILKPFKIGTKGNQYLAVDVGKRKNVRVHRLVAYAFIGTPEGKKEVNHKDGDHFNNKADNLEWVTGSENCWHAYNVLGRDRFAGSRSCSAKRVIRVEDGKIYGSIVEASKDTGIHRTCISGALNGKQSKAGGYRWEYWRA